MKIKRYFYDLATHKGSANPVVREVLGVLIRVTHLFFMVTGNTSDHVINYKKNRLLGMEF